MSHTTPEPDLGAELRALQTRSGKDDWDTRGARLIQYITGLCRAHARTPGTVSGLSIPVTELGPDYHYGDGPRLAEHFTQRKCPATWYPARYNSDDDPLSSAYLRIHWAKQ
jgi:hypothetical protein